MPDHERHTPQGWTTAGAWTLFPERRPDVLLQAGALPGHRDQRGGHRRPGDQLPGVRRPVAAGRVGVRRPRRRDDRVLALAHQPLRHRDVLDRHPAARPAARPGLRRARPARRRASTGRVRRGRARARRRRSACCTRRDPSGAWRSSRRFPRPTATFVAALATWTSGRTTRIFDAFYRGTFDAGVPASGSSTTTRSSAPTARLEPAEVAAELPVLVVPGLLVADDALLDWLRRVRRGRRASRARAPHRVRRRGGPCPDRGQAGAARRRRRGALPGVLQPRRPVPVTAAGDGLDSGPDAAAATAWVDGLISGGARCWSATTIRTSASSRRSSTTAHGAGRITTVGTVPEPGARRRPDALAGPRPARRWGELPPR